MARLTKKQEGFVKDYLDTGNATEAARRNYNVTTTSSATSMGHENMTNPDIQQRISNASESALATVIALSQGADNENVRYRASADILDRGGYKPIERKDVTSQGKPIILDASLIEKRKEE